MTAIETRLNPRAISQSNIYFNSLIILFCQFQLININNLATIVYMLGIIFFILRSQRSEDTDSKLSLCYVCMKSSRVGPLVQCDFCPCNFHMDCLDPPLAEVFFHLYQSSDLIQFKVKYCWN